MKTMRNQATLSPLFRAVCRPRAIIAAALVAVTLSTTGCNTIAPPSAAVNGSGRITASHTSTGRVILPEEIRALEHKVVLGDRSYAEVNSAWLQQFNSTFQSELSRLGIVKWDRRFDCNKFVDLYRSLAQAHYFRHSFHSNVQADAIAIGSVWYVQEKTGIHHALVEALTERGRIYIEPQTGAEVQLTPKEIRSTYFAAM